MTRLRASRPEDCAQLFDLWPRAVVASHQFLTSAELATIIAMVQRDYFPTTEFTVAVDHSDVPIGFIESDGDEIGALFVEPCRHRQGIARALIAATMPVERPWRVEVNEANQSAYSFYKALGFVDVGRRETDDLGLPHPLLCLERPPRSLKA